MLQTYECNHEKSVIYLFLKKGMMSPIIPQILNLKHIDTHKG